MSITEELYGKYSGSLCVLRNVQIWRVLYWRVIQSERLDVSWKLWYVWEDHVKASAKSSICVCWDIKTIIRNSSRLVNNDKILRTKDVRITKNWISEDFAFFSDTAVRKHFGLYFIDINNGVTSAICASTPYMTFHRLSLTSISYQHL